MKTFGIRIVRVVSRAKSLWAIGLALIVIGALAVCICGMYVMPPLPRQPKTFGRDVAENLRVWNPKTGVDRFRVRSCRLEKRKLGPLTLSGFNVLILEDVVLNLPYDDNPRGKRDGTNRAPSAVSKMAAALVPSSMRASSVRISHLEVNHVDGRRVTPVFAADELRTHGRQIQLQGCRVMEGTRTNDVGRARLVLSPCPVLLWEGGERPLDDLLP